MPSGQAMSYTFGGVKLYDAPMDEMLKQPSGMVGKHLAKVGRAIVIAAKHQVGVDTGELRNEIKMIHSRGPVEQFITVGADVPHALDHHEGTRPHMIRAKNHDFLRFSAGSRIIYTREVLHPGTRPNHYLSDQLYLVRV